MATLLIDDDYFVYPYGFATLGNFSPVLYLSKTNPANAGFIEFLELQYQLVKEHSIDAETVVVHRSKKRRRFDQLVPFALYYVPPAESALYEFGTKVLGYDIRDRQLIKSPWSDDVGSAAAFGFHLTLADALYFFTEAEVRAVVADLEIRLQDFASFDVGNFRICERFPDSGVSPFVSMTIQEVWKRCITSLYIVLTPWPPNPIIRWAARRSPATLTVIEQRR